MASHPFHPSALNPDALGSSSSSPPPQQQQQQQSQTTTTTTMGQFVKSEYECILEPGAKFPAPKHWRLADFEVRQQLIGQGSLAKVYLAKLRHYPSPFYAMKIMSKQELVRLRQAERVVREATVHSSVTRPVAAADGASSSSSDKDRQHDHEEEEEEGHHHADENGDGSDDETQNSDLLLRSPLTSAAALAEQMQRQEDQDTARASAGKQFLVQFHRAFADEVRVYFVLELAAGGELFARLRQSYKFPLEVARFYAAEIILALDYLHTCEKTVFRDLNPENILLDAEGHIKLCDFGNAKYLTPAPGSEEEAAARNGGRPLYRTFSICGVPEYVAPEVAAPAVSSSNQQQQVAGGSNKNQTATSPLFSGHSFAVDWWALGIILFEMIVGFPPFVDEAPHKIFEKAAASNRSTIPFPSWMDLKAKDLISGLLHPDPSKRLGSLKRGVVDILKHKFFAGLDFGALRNKNIAPPSFVKQALEPLVVQASTLRRCARVLDQPELAAEVFRLAVEEHGDDDEENSDADGAADGNTRSQQAKISSSPSSSSSVGGVTAQMLELQLGLPFDKFPEQTAADGIGPGRGAAAAAAALEGDSEKAVKALAASKMKPLTQAQQAVFSSFEN